MNSNDEGLFIQANWKARLVLTGYVLLMLLIAISLIYEFDRATPPEDALQKEFHRSIESLRHLINILLVITLIHAVFFCWYFVRLANNSIRAGKFPPPGTWVIVRTEIRTGKRALVSAYATYFLAVFIWLPVAMPVYLKWILEKFT